MFVFTTSCSNGTNDYVNTKKHSFHNYGKIDSLGIIHNECLDAVFKEVSKKRFTKTKSLTIEYSEMLKDKNQATLLALKIGCDYLSGHHSPIARSIENINVNVQEIRDKKRFIQENGVSNENRSAVQVDFLNGILNNFLTVISYEALVSDIDGWEEKIFDSQMTQIEKESVLSALLIGKHSVAYWKENVNKWNTLFNSTLVSVENVTPKTKSSHFYYPKNYYPGEVHAVTDPTKYHMLDASGLICMEMECPGGSIFSPETCYCEMPSSVDYRPWLSVGIADLKGAISATDSENTKWTTILLQAVLASIEEGVAHLF